MSYKTTVAPVDRDQFVARLEQADRKEDAFARTFRAKADAMGLWGHCRGVWVLAEGEEEIASAIVVRCSKRMPVVANLQLLHTFSGHRRRGYAARLVREEFRRVVNFEGAEYFRVSSELEALAFYRALGFKFWGSQKSGSQLSMFKVSGEEIADGLYLEEDHTIRTAIFTKRRGGVIHLHEGGPK